MNDFLVSPAVTLDPVDGADLCAVLVLDASGKVVAVNDSARALWGAGKLELVGIAFARLRTDTPSVAKQEDSEAAWKAFLADAGGRWTSMSIRSRDGSARDVRVRLERALGGAGTYIATVQPRTSEQ